MKKRNQVICIIKVLIVLAVNQMFAGCSLTQSKNSSEESNNKEVQIVNSDDNLFYLDIFPFNKRKIMSDLEDILLNDVQNYDIIDRPIMLKLECDTLDGEILDVTCKDSTQLIYSMKFIQYFKNFKFVKCYTYPLSGKVNEYVITIIFSKNELFLEVGCNYEDFHR